MKRATFLLGLLFVIFQTDAILTSLERSCVDENHLDVTVIERYNTQPIVPEDNGQFNQFMTCFWKKKGYQDENGQINYNNLKDLIRSLLGRQSGDARRAEEISTEVVNNCRNTPVGNSHGATASRVSNCIIRNVIRIRRRDH